MLKRLALLAYLIAAMLTAGLGSFTPADASVGLETSSLGVASPPSGSAAHASLLASDGARDTDDGVADLDSDLDDDYVPAPIWYAVHRLVCAGSVHVPQLLPFPRPPSSELFRPPRAQHV